MNDMIVGQGVSNRVYYAGEPLSPADSYRVANHSPDGFGWGYGGSGPAQLAIALLLRVGVDAPDVAECYQRFKAEVVAQFPSGNFRYPVAYVVRWVRNHAGDRYRKGCARCGSIIWPEANPEFGMCIDCVSMEARRPSRRCRSC